MMEDAISTMQKAGVNAYYLNRYLDSLKFLGIGETLSQLEKVNGGHEECIDYDREHPDYNGGFNNDLLCETFYYNKFDTDSDVEYDENYDRLHHRMLRTLHIIPHPDIVAYMVPGSRRYFNGFDNIHMKNQLSMSYDVLTFKNIEKGDEDQYKFVQRLISRIPGNDDYDFLIYENGRNSYIKPVVGLPLFSFEDLSQDLYDLEHPEVNLIGYGMGMIKIDEGCKKYLDYSISSSRENQ